MIEIFVKMFNCISSLQFNFISTLEALINRKFTKVIFKKIIVKNYTVVDSEIIQNGGGCGN